jgi:hypothetical protein
MADGWFGPLCRGRFPARSACDALTVWDSRRSTEHEDLGLCAANSGALLHLSIRQLLAQLAGIEETVLIYPSTAAGPKPAA